MTRIGYYAAALIVATCAGALAQSSDVSGPAAKSTCASSTSEPATPPAKGANAGTAPGGAGTTGFTGGLGGAYVGTSPAGPTSGSPSFQPVTARGLDPIKGMPQAANAKC